MSEGKLVQPSVSEGELVQPRVSEGKLVQPSVNEEKLVLAGVSEEKLIHPSVSDWKLVQPSVSEGKLSISRISGLPSSIKEMGTVSYLCVQFSIQNFKYLCFICTPLNLCWAVFNCVLMWLPVGFYGISSICQLSQQVHPISQIHNCECKGELWLNNIILLIQLFSED